MVAEVRAESKIDIILESLCRRFRVGDRGFDLVSRVSVEGACQRLKPAEMTIRTSRPK